MIQVFGGLVWFIIGAYCCYIFAALIWGAIRDPEFRKQFLKTYDGRTNHSLPMTVGLWVMMAILYAFFVYMTWLGFSAVIDGLS
jgi:hypothetical protein